MYLERAEEEDKKMAESWQGDAEGILVFVSADVFLVASTTLRAADWSFLRRCCDTTFDLHPGPPAEFSGFISILPREDISATLRGKWNPGRHSFIVVQPRCFVRCPEISCFGQLALVLEFGDQSHLCIAGNFAATVGETISQNHQPTVQSTQAGADPRILRRRCPEASYPLDRRSITNAPAHVTFLLLYRSGGVFVQS
jgi:hypothetical protein